MVQKIQQPSHPIPTLYGSVPRGAVQGTCDGHVGNDSIGKIWLFCVFFHGTLCFFVLLFVPKNIIYKCYPVYYSTVCDHAQVYSFNTDIYIYIYTYTERTQDLTLNAQNSEQRGRMDDMIHK